MPKPEDEYKPKDTKVRKEKDAASKQPLRTLPMRQAKINAQAVSEEQIRDTGRVLFAHRSPTTCKSNTINTKQTSSTKKITSSKSVGTSSKKGDKKEVSSTPVSSNNCATGVRTQPVIRAIRRPSLRAARRRIKDKNIKARSSKCQLFFCDKCDKVYDHYSELVYHQRRHTGEKPFVCTWPGCMAAFSASNARVRHMRIHTGEKPYVCPYSECGRRFTYWKDLKLHKLRHSGEKPHKCTWPGCSSRFFRRDDLKHHRYTHTGEKPYKCTFPGCESAFTQKSPLNLHMRKIHKVLPCSKSPEKSLQLSDNSTPCNGGTNGDTSASKNDLSNISEYHAYQPISNNLMHQMITTNILPTSDSNNVHSNSIQIPINSNNHNSYSNSNHANSDAQCISVVDKLSSILVTCDVSPATVHGVSHQFGQDVNNSWSNYTYIPENVHNQSCSVNSDPAIHHMTKESNVPTIHKSAENSNHIPNLDDLLADACAASQIPTDSSIIGSDKNDKNAETSEFNSSVIEFQTSELINNDGNCISSTINTHTTTVSTSTFTETVLPKTTSEPNGSRPSTESDPNCAKESAPSEITDKLVESSEEENAKSKDQACEKANEKTTSSESSLQNVTARPTRKRANYRIKTPSDSGKKTGIAIIRQKPVIESKSKRRMSSRSSQLGAKRTIAIQTTKRQPAEKTKDGKFKCDFCDREFKAKHDRDCHHMTHTGEKPRACDWPGCDYRCITKSKLTRNRRKHTGERNYACDWPGCGKKFSTSRHQKEHKRTHTGEKPFKCDYPGCDKWFARKDHIKNHRFTHTGEKPRKCSFPGCEAAFIQLSPLKKHMELHKRDGGPVPNRTRKRKTGLEHVSDETPKRPVSSEIDINPSTTNNPNTNIVTPIQLDALTLEMVASRMVTQHNPPVQTFNMMTQENQNVCPSGYGNVIHPNNQVNLEYEVMIRHPTYY